MTTYMQYWVATLIRGLVALVFGTAILVIPAMISSFVLMPLGVVTSILCLAAYGTFDSAILLATSFTLPHQQPGRVAMQVQGVVGATIGVVLFSLVYHPLDVHWFLYLAATQAFAIAVTELAVARGTSLHHGARWCYAAAAIAFVSGCALLLGRGLGPRELAWLLYGYLGVFGLNLFALSARMLFAERASFRAAHS